MENTLENKAKFFAQYWGCKIVHTGTGKPMRGLGKEINMCYENADRFQQILFSNQRSLLLKPLSSIAEEDANEVARLISENITNSGSGELINVFSEEVKKDPEVLSFACIETIDFCRSKGYAMSWMGLSVEKLIEYGWIKLQEA